MSVMDVMQLSHGQRVLFDKFSEKTTEKNDIYLRKWRAARQLHLKKLEPFFRQLRDALKDCKLNDSSDEYLARWLTLQDFDVERAEKMLRKSLEWRAKHGVDEILKTYTLPELLLNYFSFGHIGVDRFGCPVFVSALGRIDIKGILQCVSRKQISLFFPFLYESIVLAIKTENEKTGNKGIMKFTIVLDMEEFSIKQIMYKPGLEILLLLITRFLNFYPDTVRRAFVINAPRVFSMFFGLLKPFIHETDFPKIKIFATNKDEWTAALLDEIEADQLPAIYGGTMTNLDGNPNCSLKFNMGGEVPRCHYLTNNAPAAKDYMETINILAGAGGKRKLKYEVIVPKSILRWEFLTEGGDIGFRVIYGSSKDAVDLIPQARIESHLVLEEGQIVCEHAGKYALEFDNTYSYLRGKKLRYHIVVEPPSPENN